MEVLQLAASLSEKWVLAQKARLKMDEMETLVQERTNELHAANRDLQLATERAKLLAREALATASAKSEFLATMSHEIRTPMNGIMGMMELLSHTPLNSDQTDLLKTLQSSGDTLLAIINDILDFSKIEAGKMQIEQTEFDLHDLLEETVDLLAESAQRKQIELVSLVHCEGASGFVGDPTRLRQIILNLAGNAIKFTDQGEVALETRKLGLEDGRRSILFTVKDTGPGIADDAQEDLFRPFIQADTSITRKHGGTGLGLAICQKLTQLMGGQIGVNSILGEGATFWFKIPLTPAAAPPRSAVSRAESSDALAGVRALVVDDNQTQRRALAHHISEFGADCAIAADGEQALRDR